MGIFRALLVGIKATMIESMIPKKNARTKAAGFQAPLRTPATR